MRNLDKAMASIEIRSIATGYRVLAAILSRTDAEIRVLEAVPSGSGFAILALGEREDLKRAIAESRSALGSDADLWVDSEVIEMKSREIAESFFSLPRETLQESIVVVETGTVSGAVACAHALVEGHGLKVIEIRVLRSSSGGAYGFFTGTKEACAPAASRARARLKETMRKGRVEVIDAPSASFRSLFEITGIR